MELFHSCLSLLDVHLSVTPVPVSAGLKAVHRGSLQSDPLVPPTPLYSDLLTLELLLLPLECDSGEATSSAGCGWHWDAVTRV